MTRDEAIISACETVAMAYHSIGDYTEASDGFCCTCCDKQGRGWSYANDGKALEYMHQAVKEKLKADGYEIKEG